MKQFFPKLVLISLAFTLFACNNQETSNTKEIGAYTKSLVVFYSQNGTTKKIAHIFAKEQNADIVELIMNKPYPSTYDSTIASVKQERASKQWPALKNPKLDLSKYDTLYIGYPIMFGTFAPPIYTFLDSNDLKEKVVIPFCTYGSGGRKASTQELRDLAPNAFITLAYGISNKRISSEKGIEVATKEIKQFLENLKMGTTEEMLVGAYSEQRPLVKEDSLVFQEATQDYGYLNLKPLSVSTQVVAGTNYLFVCEMTAFGGPAVETKVKIFNPLPGQGNPELIIVEK